MTFLPERLSAISATSSCFPALSTPTFTSTSRDALAAGAEWASAVETVAQIEPGLVATVGKVEWSESLNQPALPMGPHLTAHLAAALESAAFPLKRMASSAGHDAMVMATRVPTAKLFLRSPGGLSHHPDENVREQDVEAALRVSHAFLARLDTAVS